MSRRQVQQLGRRVLRLREGSGVTAAVLATYVGPIEILRGQRALVWKELGVPRCFLLAKFDQRGLRCADRVRMGTALSLRSRAAERWERGIWVDVSLGGHQFPSCHFC